LPQTNQTQQCHPGTPLGNRLISAGRDVAGYGEATSFAGGLIIAGGAAATLTVVGAPEGVAAMAGGGTVAAIGTGITFLGAGVEAMGVVLNAVHSGLSSVEGNAVQLGSVLVNAAVGHYAPNLPDVLGPFNPVDVAANRISNGVAGGGTCQ
jgi:hypothetical protein